MRSKVFALLAVGLLLTLALLAQDAKPTAFTLHSEVTSIDLGQSTFTTHSKHHGDLTFSLAQKATFEENGQLVGFGSLAVGDIVKIHYTRAADGSLEALNVDIQATPKPHGHGGS